MSQPPIESRLYEPIRKRHEKVGVTLCAAATVVLLGALAAIVLYCLWNGAERGLNPAFIFGGMEEGMFSENAGVGRMVFGTLALVTLMTVIVLPLGVLTAVYLHEYGSQSSWQMRLLRMAINNLAGIPPIVFGLFGLGFFVYFCGGTLDAMFQTTEPVWKKPALLWASFTMAVLTLPVVVVSTEEALRSVPQPLRDASLGMGASRFQTLWGLVLPQAAPGILTGAILAISRGAGEVAPIMFVGAAYLAPTPKALYDQFLELGYHIFILTTQSTDVAQTTPLLFGTVVVLLLLTFLLNLLAVLIRSYLRVGQLRSNF